LKRCPKCQRFDVEYDPTIKTERCLWKKCGWINENHDNLEDEEYEINFSKFIKYLEMNRPSQA